MYSCFLSGSSDARQERLRSSLLIFIYANSAELNYGVANPIFTWTLQQCEQNSDHTLSAYFVNWEPRHRI